MKLITKIVTKIQALALHESNPLIWSYIPKCIVIRFEIPRSCQLSAYRKQPKNTVGSRVSVLAKYLLINYCTLL